MPLTVADLAAIQERYAASTPGTWTNTANANNPPDAWFIECGRKKVVTVASDGRISNRQAQANAVFITHAHEDVPALLDEITRLRAAQDQRPGSVTASGPTNVDCAADAFGCSAG